MKDFFEKAKTYTDWKEGLELATDPIARIEYMQKGLEEDPSEKNKWHYEILKKRYADKKGQVSKTDYFIGAWMDIHESMRVYKLPFTGKKRGHKMLLEIADRLLLTMDRNTLTDWQRDILRDEYVHLIRYYVSLSQDDRMYTGIINGYIKMKDDTIREKLTKDLNDVVYGIPAEMGEAELFAPLKEALDTLL